ncbi:hypothetical protein FA10DRAFT_262563 [Acaromyces ingoldii]|uniref:Uncharacterized protein n=1 Tax=Acaromyces ingoldii TaxID=215250 RepID=A0A316YCE7_9BASI|nr:hypothetical protein FA10DRAFT_262563 [Acaromyces ingoldii]PWN87410.1 hypothetical protein FA10DRAFT_262563 [Acaromyces ingoldii]
MILLLLYLALLASIGAARAIPVTHDDGTLVDTQWHQPRNIVEEPALFKRADGEELSYMKYLLDQAASIPQPSFAPASQYHGHGLFHDESDAFQGNQGISHHHFNAQGPVRFHTSHHQRYSQVVPRSHNAFNEPYGEGTDEIYRLHNQSYIQDLAGSHDSHYQHPSSTLDPSWSRGSPWYPYDQRTSEYSHLQHPSHVQNPPQVYDNSFHHRPNTQGTSWSHGTHFFSYGQRSSEDLHLQHPSHVQEPPRFYDNSVQHQLDTQGPSSSHGSFLDPYGPGSSKNSHFQHPSHGHGPHGTYSEQAYLYFEGSPELDDLVKQHLAHYWMTRMSHPQIDEQQSQTHAGLDLPGSHRHPPSAGEHVAFRSDEKSPSEGHVSGETSDPDVKSDRKTNWKVAKPKKPGPSATRKQVKIALIYYLRAQDVVATGYEGLLNLSEEDKKAMGHDGELFYQKICDCRGGRYEVEDFRHQTWREDK